MVVKDKDRKIKICNEILKTMYCYVQKEGKDNEAGGIIVGRENTDNNNVILEYVTVPMKHDVRTRIRYDRKDKEHLDYYKKLYNENEGIYAYYGEWHTHPEDSPRYSKADLNNWKKIARKDVKNFQYHIIVGRKQIIIWKMGIGYLLPQFVGEISWDEIIF